MKKQVSLLLVIIILLSSKVYAENEVNATTPTDSTQSSLTAIYPIDVPETSDITPYYYHEISRKLVSTTKILKEPIGYARNQLPGGTVIVGPGKGAIYYSEGGGSVSISLGAAYNFYSASISLGKKANGVTGNGVTDLPAGVAYKLFVYKDLEVKKYKVEFDYYGAVGVKYDYRVTPTRLYLEARRVP